MRVLTVSERLANLKAWDEYRKQNYDLPDDVERSINQLTLLNAGGRVTTDYALSVFKGIAERYPESVRAKNLVATYERLKELDEEEEDETAEEDEEDWDVIFD